MTQAVERNYKENKHLKENNSTCLGNKGKTEGKRMEVEVFE